MDAESRPKRCRSEREKSAVYICDFDESTTAEEIVKQCRSFGDIVWNSGIRLNKKHEKYMIVRFKLLEHAEEAIKHLHRKSPLRLSMRNARLSVDSIQKIERLSTGGKYKGYLDATSEPDIWNTSDHNPEEGIMVSPKKNYNKDMSNGAKYSIKKEKNILNGFKDHCKIQNDGISFNLSNVCKTCQKSIFSRGDCECRDNERFGSDLKPSNQVNNSTISIPCVSRVCAIGSQITLSPLSKLSSKKWLCININKDYSNVYSKLIDEFKEACEDVSNKSTASTSGELMAVKLKTTEWYRAISTDKDSWALIDEGNIVNSAKVMSVIACPVDYVKIPSFTCVLNVCPDLSFDIKVGSSIKCKIVMIHKKVHMASCKNSTDEDEFIGVIEDWESGEKILPS